MIPPMPPKEICTAVWTELDSISSKYEINKTVCEIFTVYCERRHYWQPKAELSAESVFWERASHKQKLSVCNQRSRHSSRMHLPVLSKFGISYVASRHTEVSDRIFLGKGQETYSCNSDQGCQDNITAAMLLFICYISNNEGWDL